MDAELFPKERMTAYEFLQEKPLPSIPSPTLSNVDMLLPTNVDNPAMPPSPQHSRERPPSPSYLRDKTNERGNARSATPKKEKRGLMSRKMMLLRSRTGSGMSVQQQAIPRSMPSVSDGLSEEYGSAYASSPTLMDVGNLAPEQAEEKRMSTSGSSFNSEELAGIPSFLAKYDLTDSIATDDESGEGDSPVVQKYGYSVSIEGGLDAQRKQQEEDEHNSAILSKRAEQILANAKKRLNLMEGNLRGARDLVAPLTAANLKRASSLGSSHHTTYNTRTRFGNDGQRSRPISQQPIRTLHAQASSPTMGRDYTGHARNFSETEVPERPQTAFARTSSLLRSGRIPVKANEGSWTQGLRSSRSHDSLGSNGIVGRPLHAKGSPDSNLEPLAEDDGSQQAPSARNSRIEGDQRDGLGIYRPESRTGDLREQMSSLKGKISTLKERAREDSLRRQSMQSLRTPSPFNNATLAPPEFFYTQSQSYGSPVLDTNAGVGWTSENNSPAVAQPMHKVWEQPHVPIGTRNAFAEQMAQGQQRQSVAGADSTAQAQGQRQLSSVTKAPFHPQHKRTPSGTAIVESANNRYSHHQYTTSYDASSATQQDTPGQQISSDESDQGGVSPLPIDEPLTPDYDHVVSEEEESVYEDAAADPPAVVAHEDRDDAFDYEHFFLHSAMGSYSNGKRNSASSEESEASVETAKGPTAVPEDDFDEFDPDSGLYPPPTPETPERLKEIERNLHKRTLSDESVSTVNSFATAVEGHTSPPILSRQASSMDWPMPPSDNASRPDSCPASRPSTAVKRPERRRDSSSERADSGIGLSERSNGSHDGKHPAALTPKTAYSTVATPPMSPKTVILHDPTTMAVNALLDSTARPLGLKDKALLFGLVESLRKVCHRLQAEEESQYESRVLRRRLDEARRALDGTLEQRPGTS